MKRCVIIVAGGSGSRMGANIPKQFLLLNGRPILMHTIETFYRFDKQMQIIVVLPSEQHNYWNMLCQQHNFTTINYTLVEGGQTRFHSTLNGLCCAPQQGIIAVHDGVRPLVSTATLQRCFETAVKHKAIIPAIAINESVREILPDNTNIAVNRDNYRLVQTPQVFDAALLHQAFTQPYNPLFTDDASVVEHMGEKVTIVEGNFENIKITRPIDLIIAERLMDRTELL